MLLLHTNLYAHTLDVCSIHSAYMFLLHTNLCTYTWHMLHTLYAYMFLLHINLCTYTWHMLHMHTNLCTYTWHMSHTLCIYVPNAYKSMHIHLTYVAYAMHICSCCIQIYAHTLDICSIRYAYMLLLHTNPWTYTWHMLHTLCIYVPVAYKSMHIHLTYVAYAMHICYCCIQIHEHTLDICSICYAYMFLLHTNPWTYTWHM